MTKPLKLHLGSGGKYIEGYTNIDIRYMPGVDIVNDVKFLRSFQNETVDVIYASHVLEHFGRWDYMSVLTRWFELLKSGGTLRIAVPDFEQITKYYLKTGDLKKLIGPIYGGQDYDENFHHCTWDFNSLSEDLKKIGFKLVNRYDWRTTEHSHVDDFSQCYLPHMDKENGLLMSLNIEAIK
jgi:predicted SAM-dependent methyltransferase